MIRSLYIAGTGMFTQRNRMNVIVNNIANMDTVGYRSDNVLSRSFQDQLIVRLNDPNILDARPEVGPLNTGVHVDEIQTVYTTGPYEETQLIENMAIEGSGFFQVETPDGVRFTRAGNFSVDLNGDLVNPDGFYVLDTNGAHINVGAGKFAVDAQGSITNDDGPVAQVSVVDFENIEGLRKQGDNLFYHYLDEQPVEAQNYKVRQGFIEGSNVDVAGEAVNMITASRMYQANQRILKMTDETLAKTVNDIARF